MGASGQSRLHCPCESRRIEPEAAPRWDHDGNMACPVYSLRIFSLAGGLGGGGRKLSGARDARVAPLAQSIIDIGRGEHLDGS